MAKITDVAYDLTRLTDGERQMLPLLLQGLPNKDIARKLKLSPRTVEIHRDRILRKTRARNATHLTFMCWASQVSIAQIQAFIGAKLTRF